MGKRAQYARIVNDVRAIHANAAREAARVVATYSIKPVTESSKDNSSDLSSESAEEKTDVATSGVKRT